MTDLMNERIIETTCVSGDLIGLDHDRTVEFRGIRFAAARRFDAPEDITRWHGTYDAMAFGAQAPQVGGALEQLLGTGSLPMDEDCLFLNVWSPACDDAARPVLVWIHGGAYVTGSGAMPWYDGNALAAKGDVVVVSINYRLGALGFLGDRNLGSLDMISALRWVARNIADFGGNPDDVTIFGESAGGSAVVSLLAAPAADDLFHRVWAMSPSLAQLRTHDEGAELEARFLDILGEHDTDALRTIDLERLLEAQSTMSSSSAGMKDFAPTAGTEVFDGPFHEVAAADERPLVIGTNRDEMLLFTAFDPSRSDWGVSDVEREFSRRFGDDSAQAIEIYRQRRDSPGPSQLVSAMQTDEVFRAPAQRLATDRALHGAPTWAYEFHQTSSAFGGILGSCHGLDIPFAFDNLTRQGVEMLTGTGDTLCDVADDFSSSVIDFAHGGDPGWPAYDIDARPTRIIGPDPRVVEDPEPEIRELWH